MCRLVTHILPPPFCHPNVHIHSPVRACALVAHPGLCKDQLGSDVISIFFVAVAAKASFLDYMRGEKSQLLCCIYFFFLFLQLDMIVKPK